MFDEYGNVGAEAVFREAAQVVEEVQATLVRIGIRPGTSDAQMLY